MPDPIFDHPRLAALYDAFDGDRDDLAAYVAIADELDARLVIDLGCGTGSLALRLAAAGRSVVGVDPAGASLDVARSKPGAAAVTWVHGDASSLSALGADLAVLTGNVAQALLTDDEWGSALVGLRSALRPGGHLVFETRRPEARAWEGWAARSDPVVRDVAGIGTVVERFDLTSVALPYVSFRRTYTFSTDGAVLVSDSTLRFRERGEVEESLARHGFSVTEVRDAADRPGLEYVFVARRE
jgi:SAM-dependent methyltransferase